MDMTSIKINRLSVKCDRFISCLVYVEQKTTITSTKKTKTNIKKLFFSKIYLQ